MKTARSRGCIDRRFSTARGRAGSKLSESTWRWRALFFRRRRRTWLRFRRRSAFLLFRRALLRLGPAQDVGAAMEDTAGLQRHQHFLVIFLRLRALYSGYFP